MPHVGSGPTKAHRIYLKHVIREYRAQEKRLAAHLLKFALPFLEVLRDVREEMNISAEMLPCFSLLLENFNGLPFCATEVFSPPGGLAHIDLLLPLQDTVEIRVSPCVYACL